MGSTTHPTPHPLPAPDARPSLPRNNQQDIALALEFDRPEPRLVLKDCTQGDLTLLARLVEQRAQRSRPPLHVLAFEFKASQVPARGAPWPTQDALLGTLTQLTALQGLRCVGGGGGGTCVVGMPNTSGGCLEWPPGPVPDTNTRPAAPRHYPSPTAPPPHTHPFPLQF